MDFSIGETIRNKRSGSPYLIVNIIYSVHFVVDLTCRSNPTPIMAILKRDIKNYIRDAQMDCETTYLYDRADSEELVNSFKKAREVKIT